MEVMRQRSPIRKKKEALLVQNFPVEFVLKFASSVSTTRQLEFDSLPITYINGLSKLRSALQEKLINAGFH